MPHLSIRVDDERIDITSVGNTQEEVTQIVGRKFGIPSEYIACGVSPQEAIRLNRKTIEVQLVAACDAEGVRKAAGNTLADELCAFYAGWLREHNQTGSVNVSIQYVETNPYRESET